ncbi:MAG: hypothetical protein WKF75_02560, partial [Singulisphaera sp.]
MTAVFCHNAADRKAGTWKKQLEPFTSLEFAVSDAAKGIGSAVAQVANARLDDPSAATLGHGLDVFHTTMEAHRVLARRWRRGEAAWDEAEAADAKVAAAKQRGIDARGMAQTARSAWTKATASFEEAEGLESAWGQAHAALDLFLPTARSTTDPAEAEIAAALKGLPGPDWAKVRNFLNDPRSLTFLDRMHRRLTTAEPRTDWREAMVWRWWLPHSRPTTADPVTGLVRVVGRDRELSEEEHASYDRVAAVLEDTFRASSAVECLNSVLRMQQSR